MTSDLLLAITLPFSNKPLLFCQDFNMRGGLLSPYPLIPRTWQGRESHIPGTLSMSSYITACTANRDYKLSITKTTAATAVALEKIIKFAFLSTCFSCFLLFNNSFRFNLAFAAKRSDRALLSPRLSSFFLLSIFPLVINLFKHI